MYRRPEEHPRLGAAELAYIRSDPPDPPARVAWRRLLPHRQLWAFAIGKFLTDPIWWLYLFWLPDLLHRNYGLNLTNMGPPLVVIYLVADIGSVGGGWLSSSLIKRGWSVNAGRKTAMLICALGVVPIVFAPHASSLWGAVALIGLATAAHQGWSANIFTTASDMFPRPAVGSVVGIGGMAGAVGAMTLLWVTGLVLGDKPDAHAFAPLFVIAAAAYAAALVILPLPAPG